MSEPYDGAATSIVALVKQIAAGTIGDYDAGVALSAQLAVVAPDDETQFGEVVKVLGRVDGMLLVSGPPTNGIGTVGATAIDLTAGLFYKPKTALGWTAGTIAFVGAAGPAGQITSVTTEVVPWDTPANVVAGGTPSARTLHFQIPNTVDLTQKLIDILGRADLYGITQTYAATQFLSKGLEILPLAGYFRKGVTVTTALSGLPGITISRSSVGYAKRLDGTYQSFAANVVRQTDRGILAEPAATNLMPRFAPTAAQLSTSLSVANAAEAASPPIAGVSWLNLDNTAGISYAYQAVSIVTGTSYVISCLIEAPDGVQPVIGTSTGNGDFRFNVGGVLPTTANYERLSGNVWRVWATAVSITTAGANCGVIRYAGQNTRALKFSGFQIEAGELCSSPIVTTGASATRGADNLTLTGVQIGAEVTLLVDYEVAGADGSVNDSARWPAVLDQAVNSDTRVLIRETSAGLVRGQTQIANVTQATLDVASAGAVGAKRALACRSKTNDFRMAVNGALSALDNSGSTPAFLDRLGIGQRPNGTLQSCNYIRRLVVIPTGLPDATLQALAVAA